MCVSINPPLVDEEPPLDEGFIKVIILGRWWCILGPIVATPQLILLTSIEIEIPASPVTVLSSLSDMAVLANDARGIITNTAIRTNIKVFFISSPTVLFGVKI